MRVPAWVKPLATTIGIAAAAGAAQMGIAYGLAVLLWTKEFSAPSDAAWAANLTWVCWLAATSVVIGAIAGGQICRAAGLPDSAWLQVAVAVVAAVGALITVPLAAIPARYAELATDLNPAGTTARIAAIGVAFGAVVAVGVLLGKPLAWNAIATAGWLWLVALIGVLVALLTGTEPEATRLSIWSIGESSPGWFLVMVPMLLAALGLGAGIAWLAKRQQLNRVAVAVCGAPGPLLVAVAYLVAGPGTHPETGGQFLPYLAAPYAVLTGLLGSLLVAAIEKPVPEEGAAEAAPAPDQEADRTAMLPAVTAEPEPPLPAVPVSPAAGPRPRPSPRPSTAPPAPVEPFGEPPALAAPSTSLELPARGAPPASLEPPAPVEPPTSAVPDEAAGDAGAPDGEVAAPGVPPEPGPKRKRRFRFGRSSATADMSATQTLPAVPPAPALEPPPPPAAPDPEDVAPEAPAPAEWAEEERWLEQIKGDDEPVRGATFRPAAPPLERPERRKWSLFGDDDDPDFPSVNPPSRHDQR